MDHATGKLENLTNQIMIWMFCKVWWADDLGERIPAPFPTHPAWWIPMQKPRGPLFGFFFEIVRFFQFCGPWDPYWTASGTLLDPYWKLGGSILAPCGPHNGGLGLQNSPCGPQNSTRALQNKPCKLQNSPSGPQNSPCGFQSSPCGPQNSFCGLQNSPCELQNGPP